ncbi:MAG: hypothetical protein GY853_13315 [PVC group bacterium]|nr:hypothetical protein [PVC group bacterium]
MPQNQDNEGFLLTSMDCNDSLLEVDDLTRTILLNRIQEMHAAIMMVDGQMPTQQELLDFSKTINHGNALTFIWRGQPLLRFDEPIYIGNDIKQNVHYLFNVEEH